MSWLRRRPAKPLREQITSERELFDLETRQIAHWRRFAELGAIGALTHEQARMILDALMWIGDELAAARRRLGALG